MTTTKSIIGSGGEAARTTREAGRLTSERQFRLIADHLPALVSYVGRDGVIEFANRRHQDWLGVSCADLVGRTLSDARGDAAYARLHEHVDEVLAGHPVSYESTVDIGGESRWLHTEAVPDVGANGDVRGFYALITDVTERKRSEFAVRGELARERGFADHLFEAARFIVLVLDSEGRIVRFNPYLEELSGYALEEVVGLSWFETFLPAEDRDRVGRLFRAVRNGAETRGNVNPIVCKDGSQRLIEWFGDAIPLEGPEIGVLSFGQDITVSVAAQQRARDSEARMRSVLDTVSDGIVTMDADGQIELVNSAAERMFGYRADELIGQPVMILMPPELRSAHEHGVRRYLETGDSAVVGASRELVARHKDGTEFPVEVSVNELASEHGVKFTGVVRDISDRKRLEREFVQAQKMEAIGRLASGVAHDFNNLLMGLIGCAEIALGRLDGGNPARPYVEELKRSATTGTSLTRQLLSFSRRHEVEVELIPVDDVVRDTEAMIRRLLGEDIDVTIELNAPGAWVLWDRGELEQVVMNLIVNARDAMPRGGALSIATGVEESDGLERVVLTVADTGCGMDEQTLAFLFEPFYTTKGPGEGTGLGLSTVYGFVTHRGGHLEVDSEPGRGSTFRVCVPRAEHPDQRAAAETEAPESVAGDESVLVVEDEMLVRMTVRYYLERSGYRVLEAGRPSDAIALARDPGIEIDLLVTDIVLPDQTGPDLARALSRERDLRVLFMSAYAEETLVRSGRLPRGVRALQKPFSERELLEAVRGVLDERRADTE